MQEQRTFTESGRVVHETESLADVATFRNNEPRRTFWVTLGNVDLPAFVSNGTVYIQAPLPRLFQAFAESLPDFISDLEIGISDSRGSALSLDRLGHIVLGEDVAVKGVVRGGGQW
jgi:hypothetical protein